MSGERCDGKSKQSDELKVAKLLYRTDNCRLELILFGLCIKSSHSSFIHLTQCYRHTTHAPAT